MKKIALFAATALSACVAQPVAAQDISVFMLCQQVGKLAESTMHLRHTLDDKAKSMEGVDRNSPAAKVILYIIEESYTFPREMNRFSRMRSAAEFGSFKRVECTRDWRKFMSE